MWLITTFVAAIIVTAVWASAPKRYRLDYLALMLWGLGSMILVDHVLGYEGGPFLEAETDGLIPDGTVLGIAMLIPVFMIWEISLAWSKAKGELNVR
ncbi:MAG: hypothetical protein JW724_02240 [Candidatus Altiarchaeota archaeon]|nr:hypothetical protein [Candidatus Altiarchaeota archaeon]